MSILSARSVAAITVARENRERRDAVKANRDARGVVTLRAANVRITPPDDGLRARGVAALHTAYAPTVNVETSVATVVATMMGAPTLEPTNSHDNRFVAPNAGPAPDITRDGSTVDPYTVAGIAGNGTSTVSTRDHAIARAIARGDHAALRTLYGVTRNA